MNTYVRIVSGLSKLGGLFAMALLAAAVVIVCQMIFIRYVLNASTIWQTEFVIYSLVAASRAKDEHAAWLAIAKASSYKNFAEKVPGGKELIEKALAVQ